MLRKKLIIPSLILYLILMEKMEKSQQIHQEMIMKVTSRLSFQLENKRKLSKTP